MSEILESLTPRIARGGPVPSGPARRPRRERPSPPQPAAEARDSTLRVAWVTPYGPKSDIGAFSRAILDAAADDPARPLDFVLAVNENGPSYFHAGPTLRLDGRHDEDVLQSFDTAVYNIGNNVENHGHINRLALRQPGVVVVHDLVMQHYIAWEVFERLRDPTVYADLIASHYGERGLQTLAASRICARRDGAHRPRYAPWDSPHAVEMPLIEPFIRGASAVVVHSEFAERQVARFCNAPLLRLGLPHDQKPALTEAEIADWAAATRRRDRVSFVAFGHIGRGKCLPQLIEAFRVRPELAAVATLTIAGYPTDQGHAQELVEMVRALDLGGSVRLEFAVSTERLQQIKREADVFVNLRWPNTESASGSLVEQLNTGKPTLIHDSGCYAEVPADAAFRVERVNSASAVAAAMAAAAADAERRVAVGQAGRAHAQRLSAGDYVTRLAGFLRQHGPLLRTRQAMSRRLREATPVRLVERARAQDVAWAQGLALARDAMAPILDDAPAVGPRPFLQLDEASLRSFVVLGLFGVPQPGANPDLLAAVDRLLAAGNRLSVYRATRQAVEIRRMLEAGEAPEGEQTARAPLAPRDLGPVEPHAAALLACLGPEVFAGACYVLVLGRVPARGEAAGYAARLAGGEPPSAIVREMLASAEYAGRGLPATEAERLVEAADLAAAVLRRGPARAPLLQPGETLAIRAGASPPPPGLLLGGGGAWHEPEPEGVWSAAAMARLAVRLPEAEGADGAAPAERQLRLHLRVPVRPGGPPRRLRAFVDDMLVLSGRVPGDAWQDLIVPLPAACGAAGAPIVVALDVGEALAAGDLANGNAADRRRLGLMLGALRLESAGAPGEALRRILLDPTSPVDFGGRRPCGAMLAEGWHEVEADGVWSNGAAPQSVLRVALPPVADPAAEAAERILRLQVQLPPTRPDVARKVALRLDDAAAAALERSFDAAERIVELDLPLPPRGGSGAGARPPSAAAAYAVRIQCTGAFRPCDLGRSDDQRLLGLRLIRVELLERGPRTEGAAQPCAAP